MPDTYLCQLDRSDLDDSFQVRVRDEKSRANCAAFSVNMSAIIDPTVDSFLFGRSHTVRLHR